MLRSRRAGRGPGGSRRLGGGDGIVGRCSKAKPGGKGISPASGRCGPCPGPSQSSVPPAACRVYLSFGVSGGSPRPHHRPDPLSPPSSPSPARPAPPRFIRAAPPFPYRHLALLTGLFPLHSGRSPSSHSATLPSSLSVVVQVSGPCLNLNLYS